MWQLIVEIESLDHGAQSSNLGKFWGAPILLFKFSVATLTHHILCGSHWLDIKVAFRPFRTLRHQLVCPKVHVPRDQRAGVVYQIPCSGCPKVYIGQSGRTLKHWLSEHRRAIQNGEVAASALAEHTWSTGHHMDLSRAEVVNAQPFVTTVSPGELAHSTPPTHAQS